MNKRKIFEEYITSNIDSAYRFAYTYVKNTDDAQDIVNESAAKALAHINSLKKPQYIKQWFYKIISNTAISFLKNKGKYTSLGENEIEQSTDDEYSEIMFNSIIEKLDIKYREVVVLRFLEDMKIKDISQVLGLNENTVKTRLYQALKILKIEMEEEI